MKVSIITVCYNAAQYIAQTIESVLSQNYENLEYVIVDGASDDGTLDIIKKYESDPRLYWRSEPDGGIADAMNKGVALATGDIVAHLNADDYYAHREVLAHIAQCFIENSRVVWVSGGFDFVSEKGEPLRAVHARRYSYRRLIRGNIILHPSTFIKREAIINVGGFDPSLRYCMDYDMFLRLARQTPPLMFDEQLACFRVHAKSRSLSQSEEAYAEEFAVRMKHLQKEGRSSWFYAIDYNIKRHLNRVFYRRLLRS